MVKKVAAGILGGLFLGISSAQAHFLLLKPNKIFVEGSKRNIQIVAKFTHPMEGGPNMDFSIVKSGAFLKGKNFTLHWKEKWIKAIKGRSHKVRMYVTSYKVRRPGVYQFFVVPAPYFEPAEEKFIQQITKVYVEAFGMEEGWDEPVGLKAEIVPLVKPFAIWEGNTFRGRVYFNGEPARNVEVEVEYLNTKGIKVPAEPFITQVVKTDENGYFEYTIPWAGWWGFSALGEGGKLKYKDGKEYPVELDAVIWIKAYPKPRGVR
jgi:cobalt/nickel transport protein